MTDDESEQTETTGSGLKKLVLLLSALAVLGLAALFLPVKEMLVALLEWSEESGPWGPALVAALSVPACILMIPGSIITLGAGALFGVVPGTVAVSLGSTAGACAAFWVGRTLARDWVGQKIAKHPKFKAVDDAVGRQGFKIVVLTRLSPVFPFNLQNYMYGLTVVRFWHYALASWLGMLPGTVMYVYLGSAAGSLARVASGDLERTPGQRILFWAGLVATVVVTVLITRIAKRALQEEVDETQ